MILESKGMLLLCKEFSHSSYIDCCMISYGIKSGVPRLNTPPPVSSSLLTGNQERAIAAPRPVRLSTNLVHKLEDLTQPWTRSPTKSDMDTVLAKWHFISGYSLIFF